MDQLWSIAPRLKKNKTFWTLFNARYFKWNSAYLLTSSPSITLYVLRPWDRSNGIQSYRTRVQICEGLFNLFSWVVELFSRRQSGTLYVIFLKLTFQFASLQFVFLHPTFSYLYCFTSNFTPSAAPSMKLCGDDLEQSDWLLKIFRPIRILETNIA